MANKLGEQLLKAMTVAEEEIDRQIERLEKFDDEELDVIRRERIKELKKKQQQKQEWLRNGHGSYEEIPDERVFFDITKKSNKVVCHFYLPSVERCKIVDKHLEKLAHKYLEIRFVSANADKFPFVTGRLKIRVIPTICVVMDGKTVDYIRGFDHLGGIDEFKTETLEWRLSQSGVLEYNGPSYLPGSNATTVPNSFRRLKKKTIRGKNDDGDENEED